MDKEFDRIKEKAATLGKAYQEARNSPSYLRVVGVLSGLGFLIAPDIRPLPSTKVDVEAAIKMGRTVEPRILEVLPAAVLSFPKSFLHLEKAPSELIEIVQALRTGKKGPDFEGIPFKKIYEAANRPVKNKKRKIVSERKISKTFRFSPAVLKLLEKRAGNKGTTSTAYIEMLIEKDASS